MVKDPFIELLAPARNAECGKEAILHGADAVYIGAPRFGARSAAGNSLEDIAGLVKLAHQYNARIYVTINTLLRDDELMEAEQLIHQLWNIGVDALIVQDMGITRLNLPPISLHASTQTDNRTPEKVLFLQEAGFSQVVLARELSLEQIADISANTDVKLECFVHGALCVSYSGQCYLSQALNGRSANRGECAQCCRLPYDLLDGDDNVLIRQKHLLSIRDLNRSESLERLIDAGVRSFKIEGRLKDSSYVKNITAWYRLRLDEILGRRPELKRPSSGISRYTFVPDPKKSFNRLFTDYFLEGRPEDLNNADTPKSMGEPVGRVKEVKGNRLTVAGLASFSNGDGLSFFNEQGVFDGFRVNRAEGNVLFPAMMPTIKPNTLLYRTNDQAFENLLSKASAVRNIPVQICCAETAFGFSLSMRTSEGLQAAVTFECEKVPAGKPQTEAVRATLIKLGNTLYEAVSCELDWQGEWFVPVSVWTEQRRRLVERMDGVRKLAYRRKEKFFPSTHHPYPENELSYRGNVLNSLAETFYREHGVSVVEPAFESEEFRMGERKQIPVMFCKHCIKFSMGACPKKGKAVGTLNEPLVLRYNEHRLLLEFDCKACVMTVSLQDVVG